jgi:predicted esterase
MERYQAAFLGNNPSLIRRDHPEGLDTCSERVCKLIRSVRLHSGLPSAKIVVGGFSQVGGLLSGGTGACAGTA